MQRIIGVLADLERRCWCGWANQKINLLECLGKFVDEFGAHGLRLTIVGIIIAAAEHIGTDHNATFGFGTKATGPGFGVTFFQVFSAGRTMRIPLTVVTA